MRDFSPLYVPALRDKKGERLALQSLAEDIKDAVCPRLIIPPPKERDQELGRPPTAEEVVSGTGKRLGMQWPLRPAFVDPRFLFKDKDLGEAKADVWLPRMIDMARTSGAAVIPLATLSDLAETRAQAFAASLAGDLPVQIGIAVESGDLEDEDLNERISLGLDRLKLSPNQCAVFADFSDADFSDADAVVGVMQGTLEQVQELGSWKQVIFQGTNYPTSNPAKPGETVFESRTEWDAWRKAVAFDSSTAEHLIFGDYGADNAVFRFSSGGGAPAQRHYRYATPKGWMIMRGSEAGKQSDVMRNLAKHLVQSEHFAGRTFSKADDSLFKIAEGLLSPGTPSNWREINMAHHITRVVRDIGRVKKIAFRNREVAPIAQQAELPL